MSTTRPFSCGPHVGAPAPTVALLRERAQWYLDGCPHLEELSAYQKLGLAEDAGDDLNAALALLAQAEETRTAAQAEATHQTLRARDLAAALKEAHGRLDAANIPDATGVSCEENGCNSRLGHRVKTLLDMLRVAQVVRPRVHGNGFIQIDLSTSTRLHIWGHPDIPQQKVATPVHDHTFGFRSRILVGRLINVLYDVEVDADGEWYVYQARVRHGEDTVLGNTGVRVRLLNRQSIACIAGTPSDRYTMAPGQFHHSVTHGPAASIIVKDGPSLAHGGASPRVLVHAGTQPDNEFDRYSVSPGELWRIVGEVLSGGHG
jgi:hypothetical protein